MKSDKEDNSRAAKRLPVDESREHLMVNIARMVYQQNRSMVDIADETGLNRWQVSRLLQEAQELGIVRIEIVPRTARRPEIETRLSERFGLRDVVVVPNIVGSDQQLDGVAQSAAQYLTTLKPRPKVVGVSWGRTMAAVAHWLPAQWNDKVEVVQINGTVAPIPDADHHNNVADIFARKGNGRIIPLPVPAVVGAKETRDVLERDRIVADVLQLARSAPVLVFSLGGLSDKSVLFRSGNILKSELDSLLRAGAVGDVLGHFIDRNGEIVDAGLDARVIGLSFSDLKDCPRVIGIATGSEKHEVVLGVLQAGLINVLVTDEATAMFVLENTDER